jgi:hypothetical protein
MENTDIANGPRRIDVLLTPLRNLVFGKQNERIEYIMDSYFKLSQEGRTGVLLGGGFAIFLSGILMFTLYVSLLSSLETQTTEAIDLTNQLKDLQNTHMITKQKFADLETKLDAANQNLVVIGVLEQKAKDLGLATSGFPPQLPTTELPSFNPLAEKFQNAKVEFRLSNASLKKIVDYVLAIENAPHMLKVTSLKIKALYQNKLYFDATLEVEGIVSKK